MIQKIVNPSIALFCILATASHAQSSDAGKPTPGSGAPIDFLTVDKHKSNLIRVDPEANWSQYRAYRFTPSVYEPDGSKHGLSAGDAQKVTATVDRSLQKAFKPLLEDSGAVLEVRPIVTRVKRTNTFLNLVGFAAIQAPISFGGASVRYELFDGGSGRQIGVISLERAARPWNVYPWNLLQNFESLGQGSLILKGDSGRLRKDLNRLSKLGMGPGGEPARDSVRGPVAGAE